MITTKKRHISLLLIIAVFAVYLLSGFTNALNPYVSFAEAKAMSGKTVQIKGSLAKASITAASGRLSFRLIDEAGNSLPVQYDKPAPDNFSHANEIVILGRYEADAFTAERLLVKCPSKYEKESGGKP